MSKLRSWSIQVFIFLELCCASTLCAQQPRWDAYMARYKQGAGSVTLNMDLIKTAPVKELPFLVITGVTYKQCTGAGFPSPEEFNKLYKVSEDANKIVFSTTKSELAGTFTHQCERLDYIYVHDTLNIRVKLKQMYEKKYKQYPHHIRIMDDADWEAYMKFLYPNDDVLEYMTNDKALNQLREAGDQLSQPRFIDHILYFESKGDRELFIRYITKVKYKDIKTRDLEGGKRPYQLRLTRFEMVNLEAMTIVTSELRKKAKEFNGVYDGWETGVRR